MIFNFIKKNVIFKFYRKVNCKPKVNKKLKALKRISNIYESIKDENYKNLLYEKVNNLDLNEIINNKDYKLELFNK